MSRKTFIIVAGGSGSRMKAEIPKQFLIFSGEAVIIHTLKNVKQMLPEADIVLVIGKEHESFYEGYKKSMPGFFDGIQFVTGGETRFQSVKNGLSVVASSGVTAIHDAARPFLTKRLLDEGFRLAAELGNAIPVVHLKDSVRQLAKGTNVSVDRAAYRLVQTPQFFGTAELQNAYTVDEQPVFTDDAAVFEAASHRIKLFDGDPFNIKITEPADLDFATIIHEKYYSPQSS